MKNCIISYFDCKFIKPSVNEFIEELTKLMNIILFDDEFINYFNYTSSAFHTYQFLFKLNIILKIIIDRNLQLCQIQNINKIPCLLNNEIPKILSEYHILHEFIFIDNSLYDFIKLMLNKKNRYFYLIKDALYITQNIIDCNDLHEKEKLAIIDNIISIYKEFIQNKKINQEDFSTFLNYFFILSKQILLNNNISNYISILTEVKSQINTFQDIIPYLYIYSSPKEIVFPNFEDKLYDILSKIQLPQEDKEILSKIALLIPEYCEKYKYTKEFKLIGIKLGKEFKNNPNYENLSKLISIISLGVLSSLNISPYLIQCLSVSSFLIHYIEKRKNNNFNFKGKLAQIKTGEGKSLIIAMLSLANALMGNFVDIITSTHYLAERDQIKFKKFYEQFGVSSSNIIKNNPSKSDYNGIIIYGTNTDFEFSLLREGIYKRKNIYTIPLNSNDNILIERSYDVAIVNESDNLFLDITRNSARISHPAKFSFNWMYPLIYKYFCENENNLKIKELKNILLKYENGKYKNEIKKIKDDKLKKLLNSSKIAKQKRLNLDYVIGFDEETSQKKI